MQLFPLIFLSHVHALTFVLFFISVLLLFEIELFPDADFGEIGLLRFISLHSLPSYPIVYIPAHNYTQKHQPLVLLIPDFCTFPMKLNCNLTCWLFLFATTVLLSIQHCVAAPPQDRDASQTDSISPQAPLVSDEGQLAISSFIKPDGWQVSLFASEPALANPVSIHVDHSGKIYVCESYRQDQGVTDNRKHDNEWLMADLAAKSVQDRINYHQRLLGNKVSEYTSHDDLIRRLEDTDGNGVADRSVVFAEKFNSLEEGTGAGVLVRGKHVYYACIPKLWLLTDENGDGQAESRKPLFDGFGVRVAFRGHDLHGLILGPDGRLYFSIGDRGYRVEASKGVFANPESGAVFRCELDGSNLEVIATGLRNPQELAFDDYGNLFTGDNNSDSGDKARWVNVLEGGDSGWRMMYQYISDRGPFNREKIWHPYSAESPAYIVPPIANIADGPSGLTCYPGTGLTDSYRNCFFLVDFRGGASNSGIRAIQVKPRGAFWTVERNEQLIWNILATDAEFGPDGSLWVSDWVNGWNGEGKGRVYRFSMPGGSRTDAAKEVQRLLGEGFSRLPNEQLGQLLSHPDRRIRNEAQWELAFRAESSEFAKLAGSAQANALGRLHATWGLGQIARQKPSQRSSVAPELGKLLDDSDPLIQAAAAQMIADASIEGFNARMVQLISSPEPRVQYFAAIASGKLGLAESFESVCQMLSANGDNDPAIRHAGIMALVGQPRSDAILQLKNHPSRSVRLAAAVSLRKRLDQQVASFLEDADEAVRLEAARAIHDVPELHAALPGLAALADVPGQSDPLAHRVLNANFRLGEASHAQAIAAFAGNPKNSRAMRKEALDMLLAWSEPGELDRVMNRFQPLPKRDATIAKQALVANLGGALSGAIDVRMRTSQVASKLGILEVASTLMEIIEDSKAATADRVSAIEGLFRLRKKQTVPLLNLLVGYSEAEIRAKALELLVEIEPQNCPPLLAKAVASDSAIERQNGWDLLAKINSPETTAMIESGLKQYIAGELPDDVWLNVIEAAEGRVAKSSIDDLNAFEKRLAATDPLALYRDCAAGGDPLSGQILFRTKSELSCVRCHKIGQSGGEVGPDLSEIAKDKDRRYLLESIVAPDAKIAQNFETIVVLTDDDQVLTGIVRFEDSQSIQLMNAEGKIIRVETKKIVTRKKGKSSMPDDLLKFLTRRQLRDLIAYLATLKTDSRESARGLR